MFHVTIRITTDVNLEDSTAWERLERLLLADDTILEAEVEEVVTPEGWRTSC